MILLLIILFSYLNKSLMKPEIERKTERVCSKIRSQMTPYWNLIEMYKAGKDASQFIDLIEKNQSELLSLIDQTAEFEQFWLESMVVNKEEVQTVDEFLNQEIK